MPGRRTTDLSTEATRLNLEQLARLGAQLREARRARRMSQEALGEKAGVGRMTVGRVERGRAGGVTLDSLQRIALAAGRPLVVRALRPVDEEPADAGHLALQELVLRIARGAGFEVSAELPTRPSEPWRSIDVAFQDRLRRRLVVVECWNTFGDVGAGLRASDRKLVEAEGWAAAMWGEEGLAALVWVVRDVARNRRLVQRYPELFASRFRGSSLLWCRALQGDAPPPTGTGLVWADVAAGRLVPWRRASRD